MIKTVLLSLWSGGVALGGAYVALMISIQKPGTDSDAGPPIIEFVNADPLSVPIIRDSKVSGYVIAGFSFAINKANAETGGEASPLPYLSDAAFRTLYQEFSADFANLRPQDLKQLTEKIKAEANTRFSAPVVEDVLVSSLNYVPRDKVRTDWSKQTK